MVERDAEIPAGALVVKIEKSDQAVHLAPTIQFDGAETFLANNQIVKFNLFQDRAVGKDGSNPNVPVERVVCARLVMTPQVFQELMTWLMSNANKFFAAQEQK